MPDHSPNFFGGREGSPTQVGYRQKKVPTDSKLSTGGPRSLGLFAQVTHSPQATQPGDLIAHGMAPEGQNPFLSPGRGGGGRRKPNSVLMPWSLWAPFQTLQMSKIFGALGFLELLVAFAGISCGGTLSVWDLSAS